MALMRTCLALCVALSLAGCASKKKAATTPSNDTTHESAAPDDEHKEENAKSPVDPDDAQDMKSADPCEGGE
jgi:hypothetical protein